MAEQRTEEWYAARCGKATASRIADVVAKTKTGWGASRANYKAELVTERLTGLPCEHYRSPKMIRGEELEPEARAAYEFFANVDVETVGFIDHPRIAMSGASPDGLVGKDGLVEIKCPDTSTHIETLLGGSLSGEYVKQVQWQMACTGRAWCDFVSYDPRMPEAMRLYIQRVKRDDAAIAELEKNVELFLREVDLIVTELREKFGMERAA